MAHEDDPRNEPGTNSAGSDEGAMKCTDACNDCDDDADDNLAASIDALAEMADRPGVRRVLEAVAVVIESRKEASQREANLSAQIHASNARYWSSNRVYFLVGLSICLLFFSFVIWVFQDKPDTLLPVLTALIGLVAGAGGGFIFGQHGRPDDRK